MWIKGSATKHYNIGPAPAIAARAPGCARPSTSTATRPRQRSYRGADLCLPGSRQWQARYHLRSGCIQWLRQGTGGASQAWSVVSSYRAKLTLSCFLEITDVQVMHSATETGVRSPNASRLEKRVSAEFWRCSRGPKGSSFLQRRLPPKL